MPNSYFQFKQFTVWHDKCAMKVGTDGVLLGAWTDVADAHTILDVGTGTGLVALMMAQRCEAQITAVEIDESAALQAKENVERSPWKNRVEVLINDFGSFCSSQKYDVITSNPPYFVDSLKSPDEQRSIARHDRRLSYWVLIEKVSQFLSDNGHFDLIIPTDAVPAVKTIAGQCCLFPTKQTDIITTLGALPKRTLLSFCHQEKLCEKNQLLVELSRHQYSEEYIELTKEYYLKM